jgi:phage gpG-like protein
MFEGKLFLRNVLRAMKGSHAFQERLMKGLGAEALAYSQQAFDRQALGSQIWSPRYPKQTGAKVNIAGIVADFLAGKRNPPERRFVDRPAGLDTGALKRSLTPAKALKTEGFAVTVGSVQQNASAVQFGGRSEQKITKSVVELLADFMRKSRKRIKKARKVSQPITAKDSAIQQLEFLFGFAKKGKSLVTNSGARPYLGVPNELEDKMINIIVERFEELSSGGNEIKKN